ncbi:hypothetical protein RND71_016263 [Anisodus tanguticus]|uniref:Uncharacterized protein n=1 Tax=Anisodus tanguticus TaxID=243964 RepID=A0AAE1S7G4_9SOLA|nr:hypothetical protein RND71_016263 [Anisodus tanguticus]
MQKEMLSRLDKILVDPDVDFDNCKQLRSKLIQDCMCRPPNLDVSISYTNLNFFNMLHIGDNQIQVKSSTLRLLD